MKKIFLGAVVALTAKISLAALAVLAQGHTINSVEPPGITTTIILPVTMLVLDETEVSTDDAMLSLSEEINGETESNDMTIKLAKHFEVSKDRLTETAIALENSELGLSFDTLTEALK